MRGGDEMSTRIGYRGMRIALGVVACSSGISLAGDANYQNFIVGDRAVGMGGAVAATADSMDACFYNPAGLGAEPRSSISINGTVYGIQNIETKDAAFPGEDIDVSTFVTIPTGLSAIKKLQDGTTAAFSVFVPSQSSAREILIFPDDQHYYNFSQDEQTLQTGLSLGHVVNQRLSVGASVFGVYQTASEFESLYWGDFSYSYSVNYKYSVLGVIGMVGAQYKFSDEWSAGLVLTTPSATLTGKGNVQSSELLSAQTTAESRANYFKDLDADNGLPAQVRAGLGWKIPLVASVGFDVTHHLSRSYNWMDGTQAGETLTVQQKRESVTDLQVGGEYILRKRYPVRAGFFTSYSSAPDLDVANAATLSQIDLYGLTASVGSIGESVVLNFGLSYVWGEGDAFGKRLDDSGNLTTFISETSESGLYAFISTAYRF